MGILMIIIPMKNGYFIGNIPILTRHFQLPNPYLSPPRRESTQCEEHEDQDEEPFGQIHRRDFRWHGAHHAQGPVETEDLPKSSGIFVPGLVMTNIGKP